MAELTLFLELIITILGNIWAPKPNVHNAPTLGVPNHKL